MIQLRTYILKCIELYPHYREQIFGFYHQCVNDINYDEDEESAKAKCYKNIRDLIQKD